MADIWSRLADPSPVDNPDYWEYFGLRLVEHADIHPGAKVLDLGCGTGSSLYPAAEQVGKHGQAIGIDICPT